MAAPTSTTYTDDERLEIIKRICGLIIQDSVEIACKHVGIAESTFYAWVASDESLAEEYARARAAVAYRGESDLERINAQVMSAQLEPAAANVISQNTRWLMGRRNPKVYGDKLYSETKSESKNLNVNAELSNVSDAKIEAAHKLLFGKESSNA